MVCAKAQSNLIVFAQPTRAHTEMLAEGKRGCEQGLPSNLTLTPVVFLNLTANSSGYFFLTVSFHPKIIFREVYQQE